RAPSASTRIRPSRSRKWSAGESRRTNATAQRRAVMASHGASGVTGRRRARTIQALPATSAKVHRETLSPHGIDRSSWSPRTPQVIGRSGVAVALAVDDGHGAAVRRERRVPGAARRDGRRVEPHAHRDDPELAAGFAALPGFRRAHADDFVGQVAIDLADVLL